MRKTHVCVLISKDKLFCHCGILSSALCNINHSTIVAVPCRVDCVHVLTVALSDVSVTLVL